MISTNQIKNGIAIVINGELYSIVEFQHVKPGKGGAFVRTKLKSLKDLKVIERTFRAGEKLEEAFIEQKKLQFLYRDGEVYHFIEQENFEDMQLNEKQLGKIIDFLKEGMEVTSSIHKGELVEISLPTFVELRIDRTEPGIRGDTAKGGTKPAVLETGANIQVPLFVEQGEIVKIDTRTGAYVERIMI